MSGESGPSPPWSELDSAQSELDTAKSELSATKLDLQTTKSELETAKTSLQTTKTELSSVKSDLNTAKSELNTTKSELSTAKTELNTVKSDLNATKQELDTTQAELNTTKSELDTAKEDIDAIESSIGTIITTVTNGLKNSSMVPASKQTYVSLTTTTADGTEYTAPHNGYFVLTLISSSAGDATYGVENKTAGSMGIRANYGAYKIVLLFTPCKKGDIIAYYRDKAPESIWGSKFVKVGE